jgi:hypothetical protein
MLNRLATMADALPGVGNIDLLLHPRGLELSMSKMWIWRCLDYLHLFFFLIDAGDVNEQHQIGHRTEGLSSLILARHHHNSLKSKSRYRQPSTSSNAFLVEHNACSPSQPTILAARSYKNAANCAMAL